MSALVILIGAAAVAYTAVVRRRKARELAKMKVALSDSARRKTLARDVVSIRESPGLHWPAFARIPR